MSDETLTTRRMPAQKPGRSFQDYSTPEEFMIAVEDRFGSPDHDLAALTTNGWADAHYSPEVNALTQDWSTIPPKFNKHPVLWLNPPFARIAPWAKKCSEYKGKGTVLLLTPASVGARWFKEHIFGQAQVLFLSPRLSFDGKAPYPKDLMLSVFGRHVRPVVECWNWKTDERTRL